MWPFDPNNQQMYQQYAQAYNNQNYNGIDHNQAMEHMQQFVQNAPPNFQQQVYQQHFEQMPYDQRMQFAQQVPPQYQYAMPPNNPQAMAQGFYQMGQQQPNMLSRVFGQGGAMANPLVSGGLGALVGIAATSIIGQQGGMFGDRDDRGGYGRGDDDGGYRRDDDDGGYRRRDDDDER